LFDATQWSLAENFDTLECLVDKSDEGEITKLPFALDSTISVASSVPHLSFKENLASVILTIGNSVSLAS
jgi:hypothetical protein